MAKITELNNNDDSKVMEQMLELNLVKYEITTSEEEKQKCEFLINLVYNAEKDVAEELSEEQGNSIGFEYILKRFKNYKRSINYFASMFIEELISLNIEDMVHSEYSSFDEFISDKPKVYLIDAIFSYDEELADYIKLNTNLLDKPISDIKDNWDSFRPKDEYEKMYCELSDLYNKNLKGVNHTKSDIIIYLSLKNGIIDKFKKYYIMEDTTPEEVDELIKENRVKEDILSSAEIKLIAKMDKIIKKTKDKKIKRLNN